MSPRSEPDVAIAAEAELDELRFLRRPQVELRAGERTSEREGLPQTVRPGITYRRVRAAIEAARRLRG